MNKKDPSEPRLKNVTLDSEVWGLKGINVDSCFKSMGRQPKTVSKGVVGVKNLVWPGWLTIGYEGKFSSVYVGYGHKSKNQYYPSEP